VVGRLAAAALADSAVAVAASVAAAQVRAGNGNAHERISPPTRARTYCARHP
jgi:hypothetical protein